MNVAHLHLSCWDFTFCHLHKVSVKNHEISVFPDFDAAFAVLEEAAFGHLNRDGTQGLLTG